VAACAPPAKAAGKAMQAARHVHSLHRRLDFPSTDFLLLG
jgi:hypothetical protein